MVVFLDGGSSDFIQSGAPQLALGRRIDSKSIPSASGFGIVLLMSVFECTGMISSSSSSLVGCCMRVMLIWRR